MTPGRELDTLVAEKVFKYSIFKKRWKEGSHSGFIDSWIDSAGFEIPGQLPEYSTDISAAWEVVEKLRPELCIEIMPWGDNYHVRVLSVTLEQKSRASCRSAPHAICLAALKAVGHEFKESTEEL